MSDINVRVRDLLKKNTISGHSGYINKDYHFMKPSRGVYKSQYFWDTCFHVMMMCEGGMGEMAKRCMESLFALQEQNGFVGHIIYWNQRFPSRITDIFQSAPSIKLLYAPTMTRLLQPPLPAEATWQIYQSTGDTTFLKRFVPRLIRYYDWLWQKRMSPQTGLLFLISYFESGMDWKPAYDPAIHLQERRAGPQNFMKVVGIDIHNFMKNYDLDKIYRSKKFIVNDAAFNAIAAINYNVLAKLCQVIDEPAHERFSRYSEQLQSNILKHLYDANDSAFYDLDECSNSLLKVKTPTIFYPLLMDKTPKQIGIDVIHSHYQQSSEFNTTYPVPSVSTRHPSFNPDESMYIWRGPTWAVNNFFVYRVLKKHGFNAEAENLKKQTGKLISKSGFREYYNPFTGQGYGAKDFTWSGLYICMK